MDVASFLTLLHEWRREPPTIEQNRKLKLTNE